MVSDVYYKFLQVVAGYCRLLQVAGSYSWFICPIGLKFAFKNSS